MAHRIVRYLDKETREISEEMAEGHLLNLLKSTIDILEIEIQWWTGRVDVNGKHLFSNDVFLFNDNHVGIVQYSPDKDKNRIYIQYSIPSPHIGLSVGSSIPLDNVMEFQIMGNLRRNPDIHQILLNSLRYCGRVNQGETVNRIGSLLSNLLKD